MLESTFTINNLILGITVGVSILAFYSHDIMYRWIFSPYEVRYHKQYYRFITSGLLHANWMHLFFNMYVLYQFGNAVELLYRYHFESKGEYYFITLYVGGLIVSNLPSYFKHHNDPAYQSLGASGAVSAVLFSFIIIDPFARIGFIIPVLAFPAIVWGVLYLLYEYWASKKQMDNISHDAHIMGAIYGVLLTILLRPSFLFELINHIKGYFF